MSKELKSVAPDIIHAHWTYEFADAGLSTGLLCLVTARDAPWLVAWYFREFYRLYRALYSSLWIVPRVHYLTVVSEHIKTVFSNEPFFKKKRIWVTPNGLDGKFFAPKPKVQVSNPEAPVFFATSGWSYLKNLGALLEAFKIVRQQLPDAQLKLVGAIQGEGGWLERHARKRNLFHGVTLIGILPYKESLALVEAEADIVVHPTKEESFSMVVLEAMAKGVPVVGGLKSGAVPWLLDYGQAGVLVDINSPEMIANGMLGLVKDKKLYSEMAQIAHQRALDYFTMDKVVERYLEVYDEVVDSHRLTINSQ
jgi:glycosyltransferase involved in cell wall biosynthesis